MTYAEALAQYHLRPEAKFLNGDFCDRGRTERRHVVATQLLHIGKEANKWEEQHFLGEDEDAEIEYGVEESDGFPRRCNSSVEQRNWRETGIAEDWSFKDRAAACAKDPGWTYFHDQFTSGSVSCVKLRSHSRHHLANETQHRLTACGPLATTLGMCARADVRLWHNLAVAPSTTFRLTPGCSENKVTEISVRLRYDGRPAERDCGHNARLPHKQLGEEAIWAGPTH